ncbi:MAG TPA: NAD(P)-dependent oxidoreductase [Alphaproteobacteria bacterium]|nr:NAD(P)-dependent oxidoreductase [Alphaproteobacteria bacterium]
MNIGIAGLGRMGAAIGTRLMAQGHKLVVWNRTADKTKALADAGAAAVASPAELAGKVETVITILTDAKAIDAVFGGPDGLLSGDVKGKLFIDMSTVRPETEKTLGAKVKAKGAAFVECPVGGTTGPARDGKLLGFAGGELADFERAKPILTQLCRRVEHCGPVGAGASMKLAINLPLLVYWRAFAEAMSLCRHLGKDPAWFIDVFADTSGGTNALKMRGPALTAVLGGKDPGPVTFDIDSIRKDLRTMIDEGKGLGAELPVTARTLELYDEVARQGFGGKDATHVVRHWLDHKGR